MIFPVIQASIVLDPKTFNNIWHRQGSIIYPWAFQTMKGYLRFRATCLANALTPGLRRTSRVPDANTPGIPGFQHAKPKRIPSDLLRYRRRFGRTPGRTPGVVAIGSTFDSMALYRRALQMNMTLLQHRCLSSLHFDTLLVNLTVSHGDAVKVAIECLTSSRSEDAHEASYFNRGLLLLSGLMQCHSCLCAYCGAQMLKEAISEFPFVGICGWEDIAFCIAAQGLPQQPFVSVHRSTTQIRRGCSYLSRGCSYLSSLML